MADLPASVLALVDAAVDATAVVDESLRVVHANRAYAALLGRRDRDLKRNPPFAVCHELLKLESCREGCLGTRALQANRALRLDEVRTDDRTKTFIVTALPFSGSDGARHVVETYRDVTAESRMQTHYKDLLELERRQKELLQEQVEQRTAELKRSVEELQQTRAQLVQSEKMSSLGVLVAGIAHELNNPINFIYANIDFLEQHAATLTQAANAAREVGLSEEQRARLEERYSALDLPFALEDLSRLMSSIRAGAERVANIVADLRTFSHGGGRGMHPTDLNAGVVTTLNLARQLARERVKLTFEPGELPKVFCDGPQVNQVFMNLVSNAIQATPGAGEVVVRTSVEAGHARVDVVDHGAGIPDAIAQRIFDPFFTTKAPGEGTGLGLAISLGIVNAHRGSLTFAPTPGGGTTFTVRLPLTSAGDAA